MKTCITRSSCISMISGGVARDVRTKRDSIQRQKNRNSIRKTWSRHRAWPQNNLMKAWLATPLFDFCFIGGFCNVCFVLFLLWFFSPCQQCLNYTDCMLCRGIDRTVRGEKLSCIKWWGCCSGVPERVYYHFIG